MLVLVRNRYSFDLIIHCEENKETNRNKKEYIFFKNNSLHNLRSLHFCVLGQTESLHTNGGLSQSNGEFDVVFFKKRKVFFAFSKNRIFREVFYALWSRFVASESLLLRSSTARRMLHPRSGRTWAPTEKE